MGAAKDVLFSALISTGLLLLNRLVPLGLRFIALYALVCTSLSHRMLEMTGFCLVLPNRTPTAYQTQIVLGLQFFAAVIS